MIERTLSILKPDCVRRNLTGLVNAKFEGTGLRIIAQKRVLLTRTQAEEFYQEHSARPFFSALVDFMISGPVVVQVLSGQDAIGVARKIMGATNPVEAEAGTIRREFAKSIDENIVHGSDSAAAAVREISFFFAEIELVSK